MKKYFKILLELTKFRITIFVTITTVFGFICKVKGINSAIILPAFGILMLACGSAVINHIQERKTDKLMNRTKNRPLPSGKITLSCAVLIAIFLCVSGTVMIYFSAGLISTLLALLNLVWYNVIYTPLKKKNPLAIIPGSLVGAIPPAVGWTAAGGSIFDPQIIVISFFFFIWQIPHFWLLLLVLNKDYEKAGFPTLTKIFNTQQLSRITFMWIAATVATALLIPLFGLIEYSWIAVLLLLSGLWLISKSINLLKQNTDNKIYFKPAFIEINAFALIVVILLSIDKILFNFKM